jgi:restriction system protein
MHKISKKYLDLACHRVTSRWPGYQQPEDFGYDFREWVSPYTKGAHALGGIAIVLQDWASVDTLNRGPDPDTQEYGLKRNLLTNKRLEALLESVFGLSFHEVYVTNIFPFIKRGGISSHVPLRDAARTGLEFTKNELEIVKPKMTLGLGRVSQKVLDRIGIQHIKLPHPAARIGDTNTHEVIWHQRISEAGRPFALLA